MSVGRHRVPRLLIRNSRVGHLQQEVQCHRQGRHPSSLVEWGRTPLTRRHPPRRVRIEFPPGQDLRLWAHRMEVNCPRLLRKSPTLQVTLNAGASYSTRLHRRRTMRTPTKRYLRFSDVAKAPAVFLRSIFSTVPSSVRWMCSFARTTLFPESSWNDCSKSFVVERLPQGTVRRLRATLLVKCNSISS